MNGSPEVTVNPIHSIRGKPEPLVWIELLRGPDETERRLLDKRLMDFATRPPSASLSIHETIRQERNFITQENEKTRAGSGLGGVIVARVNKQVTSHAKNL